ncbi:ATP-binding protein [Streptomyces zingiberis]|nr:ATP-binding protein [Streptomyces zingiberis]
MTTPRAHATGVPGYSETWPSEPETAGRARKLVKTVLHTWNIDGEVVDDAVLITSELVTNSIVHSKCRLLRLSVTRPRRDLVQISVTDKSRTEPEHRDAGPEEESGRGLMLVRALAGNLGVELRSFGKTVTAELEVPCRRASSTVVGPTGGK